jgi:hypothetical protein
MRIGLRRFSWMLGGASIILPCAFFSIAMYRFDQWAKTEGLVCGLPIASFALVSTAMFVLLSSAAGVVNKRSLRRELQPIGGMRKAELHLFFVPLYCAALLIAIEAYDVLFAH